MSDLLSNQHYRNALMRVADLPLPWQKLTRKTIVISGATGLIGTFLIDVLMMRNRQLDQQVRLVALTRNESKAKERFAHYWEDAAFSFVCCDISQSFSLERPADFVIHLASATHPLAYAEDPIGTISANVSGTMNLLELAARNRAQRFLLASTVEIYGENRGDVERFKEDYCGYLDANTLRAGYPESKRVAEAMCQAYKKQKQLDVAIARLSRIYGPTMLMSDSKAISQFIKNGLKGEDIVLKSKGEQLFSYCYVADAVAALLTILLCGENGEAYNIADVKSDVTLADLAQIIAGSCGRKVVFDLPNAVEAAGFSKASKALLDSTKLSQLGWNAAYTIETGMAETLSILRSV